MPHPSLVFRLALLLLLSPYVGAYRLQLIQTVHDGQNGVTGLNEIKDIQESADLASIYVISGVSQATVLFTRSSDTGVLTFVKAYPLPFRGFQGLLSVDQRFLYVSGVVQKKLSIAVFERNMTDGTLTMVQLFKGGADGLGAFMTQNPGGDLLYLGYSDNIDIVARNPDDGRLTLQSRHALLNTFCVVAMSPDGQNLYAASDRMLLVFDVAPSGRLQLTQNLTDGSNDLTFLEGADAVLVSSDGLNVYVGCFMFTFGSWFSFARDPSTGGLTLLQSGDLLNVASLAESADGQYVVAAAHQLEVFHRNQTGALREVAFERYQVQDGIGVVMAGNQIYIGSMENYVAVFDFITHYDEEDAD